MIDFVNYSDLRPLAVIWTAVKRSSAKNRIRPTAVTPVTLQ